MTIIPPQGSSGAVSVPSYGMTPANFPHFRKAVANARNNLAASSILCCGTSVQTGSGASPNAGTQGFPAQLATLLNANVCPTQASGLGINESTTTIDNRLVAGANASFPGTGHWGFGGTGYMALSASIVGTTAYTSGVNADTVKTWYVGGTLTGGLKYNVDGGSTITFQTQNGGGTIIGSTSQSLGAASTTHVVNYLESGTFSTNVIAIETYLSTQLGLRVWNCGVPGIGTSNAWVGQQNPGSSLNVFTAVAPSLCILEINIDDCAVANPTSLATYLANMQTIIAFIQALGCDVLLWTDPQINPANATYSLAQIVQFNGILFQLAAQFSCGIVDISSRFGPWATGWNALGFANGDLHPNQLGSADIATAIARALASVV